MNGILLALSVVAMLHRPAAVLRVSDVVVHEQYGTGVVIGRWGSFLACPGCTEIVGPCEETPCCGRPPFEVNAETVCDVRFKSGVYSVNQCWLKVPQTA